MPDDKTLIARIIQTVGGTDWTRVASRALRPEDGPPIDGRDARNHVSNMLRQAWDRAMAARGLSA